MVFLYHLSINTWCLIVTIERDILFERDFGGKIGSHKTCKLLKNKICVFKYRNGAVTFNCNKKVRMCSFMNFLELLFVCVLVGI